MIEKYKIIGTTADVKLRVFAKNKAELFKNAALGMLEILKPNCSDERTEKNISVESSDPDSLLIDFLNELLCQMQISKECYQEFEIDFKNDTKLKAELKGNKLKGFSQEIKAATYYNLRIYRNEGGNLECEVVFDI